MAGAFNKFDFAFHTVTFCEWLQQKRLEGDCSVLAAFGPGMSWVLLCERGTSPRKALA